MKVLSADYLPSKDADTVYKTIKKHSRSHGNAQPKTLYNQLQSHLFLMKSI